MTHLAEIWVPETQNNYKNNSTNFTRGHMGRIPVIRCFVQKCYMVAYVTKASFNLKKRKHIETKKPKKREKTQDTNSFGIVSFRTKI